MLVLQLGTAPFNSDTGQDVGGLQIDVFHPYEAPSTFYSLEKVRLDKNLSAFSQGFDVGQEISCVQEER